jgi:hypothetical protein
MPRTSDNRPDPAFSLPAYHAEMARLMRRGDRAVALSVRLRKETDACPRCGEQGAHAATCTYRGVMM